MVGSNSTGGIQTLGPQLNHRALSSGLFQFNDPNTELYVLKDATLPPPQNVALVLDSHCVAAAVRLPGMLVPMISVHAGTLWALAAALVALRLWLLRRDALRAPGVCRKCGYARAGLAVDARCPECGAGRATA